MNLPERVKGLLKGKIPSSDPALVAILLIATLLVFNAKIFMGFEAGYDYVYISGRSVDELFNMKTEDQPPFYFLLLKAWTAVFGIGEVSIRLLLYLFYITLIASTYKVGLDVFSSRITGLTSSLLVCLNPVIIFFTFDPKYWMVVTSMTMLSLLAYTRFYRNPTVRWQIIWGVSLGLLPFTCLVGFSAVAAFFAYSALMVALKRIKASHLIVPLCIVLLFSYPVVENYVEAHEYLTTVQEPREGAVDKDFTVFFREMLKHIFFVENYSRHFRLEYLYLASILVLFGVFMNRATRFNGLLLLYALTVIIGGFYASKHTNVRYRYFIVLVPVLFLYACDFISKLRFRRISALLCVLLILPYSFFAYDFFTRMNFPEWAGAGRLAGEILGEDETLVSAKRNFNRAFQDMYVGESGRRYRDFDDFNPVNFDSVVFIHSKNNWPRVTEPLRAEFNIQPTWNFNGVFVQRMSRYVPRIGLLSNQLREANILLHIDDGIIDCSESINRDLCYSEGWMRVEEKRPSIGGFERRCIFAHPRNGQTLEVAFPDVVLDESLYFFAGIADPLVDERAKRSQSYVDVVHDGVVLEEIIVPSRTGYHRFHIPTSDYAGGQGVSFRISTDDDTRRHFCFNAGLSAQKAETQSSPFYDGIGGASVTLRSGNTIKECDIFRTDPVYPHNERKAPFREGKLFERWDCEPDNLEKNALWKTVAKGFDSSGGDYRRALWAHPHPGQTLSIEYPNTRLTGSLSGFYGFNDLAFEMMPETNLSFRIFVDDRLVHSDTIGRRVGWVDFKLAGSGFQGLRDVRFEVESDQTRWAHFFFNAFT
jgi:hypothetical protein